MERILKRLSLDRGTKIPRSCLTKITQDNLNRLEEYGFDFEDIAYMFPVRGRNARSYIIVGIGPCNEHTKYVRYETENPTAGQTLLYIDGERYQMNRVLVRMEGRSWNAPGIPNVRPREYHA